MGSLDGTTSTEDGVIPPLPPGFKLNGPAFLPVPEAAAAAPEAAPGLPPLPPGFTLVQPAQAGPAEAGAAPAQEAVPQVDIPPLPKGFKLQAPEPTPPRGNTGQVVPAPAAQPETAASRSLETAAQTEEEYPSFVPIVGGAFARKMAEAATNLALGGQVILPQGVGGKTLAEVYEDERTHPKTKDKIDRLLETPLSSGWNDWRWWTAQLAGSLGAVGPGLGVAGAATLAGGPLAGIAGFAGEAAIERLPPAYIAARAAGLDNDAAIKQALVTSGVTASFAAAMGIVGKTPLTGVVAKEVDGVITQQLAHPVKEAFVQMGLVQPGLMGAQSAATSIAQGETPSLEQVATEVLLGGLSGYAIHRSFLGFDRVKGLVQRVGGGEESAPATEASILAAAEGQRQKGLREQVSQFVQKMEGEGGPTHPEPATPDAIYDKDLSTAPFIPAEVPSYFYSHLSNTVADQFPERMKGSDVVPWLKGRGVKDSELEAVEIKPFLADTNGHVSKQDLLAHIESKQVEVKENLYRDPVVDPMERAAELFDHLRATYGPQENWPPRVKREFQQIYQEGRAAAAEAKKVEPQYRSQLIPGLRSNPREYVFSTTVPTYDPEMVKTHAVRILDEQNRPLAPEKKKSWQALSETERRFYMDAGERYLQSVDPRVFGGTKSHYQQNPNQFAHTRVTFERDRDGVPVMVVHEIQSDAHQLGAKEGYRSEGGKIADLPFKTNWQDLVVKRLMQLAADHGAERLVLANGDQVGYRLGTVDPNTGEFSPSLSQKQVAGARQNYDRVLPGKMKHWGKQYGAESGFTRFDHPDDMYSVLPLHVRAERRAQHDAMGISQDRLRGDMPYIQITPAVASNIRMGMAFHDTELAVKGGRTFSDLVQENKFPERLARPAGKIDKIIRQVANMLGISRGITINALPMDTAWRGRLRDNFDTFTGNYIIDVNTKRILTEHDLYASMSHEFGHVIFHNVFMTARPSEQAAIFAAFQKHRAAMSAGDIKIGDARRIRDNAISIMTGARAMHNDNRMSDLVPGSKAYFLSMEEWFSEQVAKWMQTSAKPLGVVDGFFKKLANKVRKMLAVFSKEDPLAGTPEQVVKDFLEDRWGMPSGFMEPIKEQFERDSVLRAQAAFDKEGAPETKAVPEQASTAGGRDIVRALGLGREGGEAMAGHADRMNAFFDLALTLPQIQELNPHLRQLAIYAEMHRTANLENNIIMNEAYDRTRQWGMIRDPKQQLSLTKFINDYANGLFKLPHTEDGLFRRPNTEEFTALVQKHGLSDQSVRLFQGITKDFDAFLEKYRTLLVNDAMRVKDPNRARINVENINKTIDKLLQRPFIPLTRFGKYLITVYDAKGNIRHSEQTNSLRRQRQIVDALKAHSDRLPGDIVLPGEVPKDATPFLGMPPGLIDLISNKLSLSDSQKGILDQLRFDYAPGHSFKHQFRDLDLVPGYSTDFMRNYTHFFFHGARHVTRVKWVDAMRDEIRDLGSDTMRKARAGNKDGANKLDQIVKFMQKHFDAWVDPKSDWAGLRGLMFHWYLGFNPASAAVNLTQSPLMTYPFLAAQYGDFKAMKAMLKASLDLNNFYKKGTLVSKGTVGSNTPENFMARALGEMVKRGTISETQAHQLAALSQDRNLLRNFGKPGEAAWLKFQESSPWMFEMTEQYNRRLAARAALELAYSHPNSKEVKTAIAERPILYNELVDPRGMNWTPQEAGAFVAAQRAVDKTQFDYSQYARPRLMRGPIGGTAFVFKLFAQNTLFNLLSQPAVLARWTVIMAALGGMQGLMGFENVNSLIKTLAYRLFGADFDVEDQARRFAHDVLNDKISPDILMHGLSVKGFGIPAVMHSMGMNWAPTMDMSKSVGFGDVIGFDPFRPLGPTRHPKEEELRQIQRAAGAAFGLPLSIYDFATSNQNFGDLKKYETIAPRFLGNLSHAFRWATQGKETNNAGNAVVRFNVADTEQMMEILARAGGFQPRRLTEEWGRIAATTEASNFWDLSRQGLLRQFAETVKTNDPEGKKKVVEAIRQYNATLPEWARTKAITGAQLSSSVEQRLKVQQRQEEGLPAAKANVPIAREMEKYYPRGWPKDLQSVKPVQ